MKPPRLLILGGGPVVTEFYLPALLRLGWTTGIAVADPATETLTRVGQLAPWVELHPESFQELLSRNDVSSRFDAAIVAVPNSLHVPAIQAALRAGLPVLAEKPLALRADECRNLGELADSLGLPLAVGMVRRWIPAIQGLKAATASGIIGDLQSIEVEHGGPYGWISDSGAFFRRENGGILADLGVHYLDWIAGIVGPLTPLSYQDDSRGGVEAACSYKLQTSSGIPVSLELSHRHRRSNTVTFRGSLGTLVLERDQFAHCRLEGLVPGSRVEIRAEQPFSNPRWPLDFVSCFSEQFLAFSNAIRGGQVTVTAGDALRTTELIEHAYRIRDERGPAPDPGRPSLCEGRTLVTGGTGFIGGTLLERLTEIGFLDIRVPVRNYRTCVDAARFPVQLVRADLKDRETVRSLVQGVRWVFHLAYGQTEIDAQAITVDATKILVEEAVAAGVETIVILSTMGVFGHPETDSPVDETWPYAPAYGAYGATKATMEQWCLDPQTPLGSTRLVVLNPSCVYGPGGKTYTKMPLEFARDGKFAWIEGGQGTANYVYVDNLIDSMLLVSSLPSAHRNRYLVNDGSCTWRHFVTPFLGSLAASVPNLTLPELLNQKPELPRPSTLRQIVSHLLSDLRFLELVNRHAQLGKLKQSVLKRYRHRLESVRADQKVLVPAIPNAEVRPTPPPWLGELFGPTKTHFSSSKLRKIGWKSLIYLQEGQQRTIKWLSEAAGLS